MKTYTLEGKIPILKPFWEAFSWRDDNKEKYQLGRFVSEKFLVSTVFIGMDYGYSIPPLLFETMIFNKEREIGAFRYHDYDLAKFCHNIFVELVEKEMIDEIINFNVIEITDLFNWFPINKYELNIDYFKIDKKIDGSYRWGKE